ncbi:MAG TPA: ShlB/FhaC/HecB family hemolysin secretion/activation protein [Micropepsaceae bacterium]
MLTNARERRRFRAKVSYLARQRAATFARVEMVGKSMKLLAGFTVLLLTGTAALAQSAPPRLSVPDAGHVLTPPLALPAPGPTGPMLPQQPDLPAADQTHLRFTQVEIVGAVHLPEAKIAAAFDAFKGKKISGAELKTALDKVNALYAEAGYPLGRAFVPAQKIKNGILTVRVVEGYIESIAVNADSEKTKVLVERMAARLTAEKPLTRETLEQVILSIQDLPGITLGSKFEAMNPETGGTRLVLAAQVRWVTVGLSLDNRANLQSLPFQPYATATLNNLLGQGDRISLTALLSPRQKDYAFYDLGYSQMIGSDGLNAGLDAAWAQTLDNVSLRPFEVRSRVTRLSTQARYPLKRGTDENINLTGNLYYAGANYSLSHTSVGTFANDRNLALQLGGDYMRIFSPAFGVTGNASITQGLAGFAEEPHTRLHTIDRFTKLRAEGHAAWQPFENMTLKFGAMGQYSPNSLIASEEVAFGGLTFGRGFDTSEISGDEGIGFSFQPEYRIALGSGFSITPYPLIDYAKAYNRRNDLQPNGELVSTGVGARFGMDNVATMTLELDKPLNRTPFGRRDRGWRVYAGFEIGVDGALSLIGRNL